MTRERGKPWGAQRVPAWIDDLSYEEFMDAILPIPPQDASLAPPPLHPPRVRRSGGARSLAELAEDPELTEPPKWDLFPYTVEGRISLVACPPKSGKTTFAALYAARKATGRDFLGRQLRQAPILWAGPDEHLGDQYRRFMELDGPDDLVFIWDTKGGPPPSIDRVAEEARALGAGLVVLDTLPRIAKIADENDNAAWTLWSNQALPLIRSSGGVWLAIHHDRKSGGEGGAAIRGASAIFGFVDIAFSLRRVPDHRTRRCLRIEGTRYEDTEDLLIDLQDREYVVLGDPRNVEAQEDPELMHVRGALTAEPATVNDLAMRLDSGGEPATETTLRRHLDKLVALGMARREGRGGQRDPLRYRSSTAPNPIGVEKRRSSHGSPAQASGIRPTSGCERFRPGSQVPSQ